LEAEIIIRGLEREYVKPRRSHPANGRFDRLLSPGSYAVRVQKKGYRAAQFENIEIHAAATTPLEIALQREAAKSVISNE